MRSIIATVLGFVLALSFGINAAHAEGWVSSTTGSDAENLWTGIPNAIDGNTATYASDQSNRTGDGSVLELQLAAPIYSGRLRVNADFGYQIVDSVTLSVLRDGTWSSIYTGVIDDAAYSEITFTPGQVSAVRFNFHYLASGYYFWLYELSCFASPPVINPPTVQTLSCSDPEQTTAILHGKITDDGGAPCTVRFEYGTDTNYETATPWMSSFIANQTFGSVITGLTNGVTYHFHAQAQNSEGTIASGNDATFTTAPPPPQSWVSPTGYADPDNVWQNPTYAFDDEMASYARSYHNLFANAWGSYLYLTHAPLQCDWIRFNARQAGSIDAAEVDVFDGTQWTMVYQGSFTDAQWMEVNFPQTVVSQARIRFHVSDTNQGLYWQLYEFDFHTAGLPRAPGWVSPTSGQDAEGHWLNIPNAYDGNVDTYAQDWSNRAGDGSTLELDLNCPIHCGRLRVNADFGYGIVDSVRIEVLRNGSWITILSPTTPGVGALGPGVINNAAYTEIPFASGQVSAMRFTYHYLTAGWVFWLYEASFYSSPQVIVPPAVQTLDATSVDAGSAILHGKIVDDGGDLVQYRFEYGLDTTYGTQTPWTGSLQSGNVFGTMITGLINGPTYHFHVQEQNSTGTIVSGSDDSFTTAPIDPNVWITPTGSAGSGNWENAPLAIDDELNTFARDLHNLGDNQWGDYIYFTHAAMNVSGIRFQAKADVFIDQAEVGLSSDGTNWATVFSGSFTASQWLKVPFDPILASQFRVRFHVTTTAVGEYFQLYEFNFTGNRALAGPYANPDSYSTNAGQSLTVAAPGVLGNDPDNLALTAIKLSDPANGTLTLNLDGSFTYVPNANFSGTDTFTYKANNGTYDSNIGIVAITVVAQNGAPSFTNLRPTNGFWTNLAQPLISADIVGSSLDYDSLQVEIDQISAGQAVALSGMLPTVSPNHFDLQVPYDLDEGNFQVIAQVNDATGDPGNATWSFNVDLTNPVISGLPAIVNTNSQTPTISATFSDVPSGVDPSSVKLVLDNNNVTQSCTITANSISFTPATNLAFGTHSFVLTVKDLAGNSAAATCTLTITDPNVDITPPVFGAATPANGAFVSCVLAQPAKITLNYNDTQSGVDPASAMLQIDGHAVTLSPGAATSTALSYTLPSTFSEGQHTWSVSIKDHAGNSPVPFLSMFNVDNTPPTLTLSPAQTDVDSSTPLAYVSGFGNDGNGAGIDWTTLKVSIDGIDYTAAAQIAGDSFVVAPPQPLAGAHVITASVTDKVGNPVSVVKTQTLALSHLAYQDTGGNWIEPTTNNFYIPLRFPPAMYTFRVAYAADLDPNSFAVTTNDLGSVVTIHPAQNGFISFTYQPSAGSPGLTYSTQFQLTIANGATNQVFSVNATVGFYDNTTGPTIQVASPNGGQFGPFQTISALAMGGSPFVLNLIVNNTTIYSAQSIPFGPQSMGFLNYTPTTPWSSNTISYTITAVDVFGHVATFNGSFDVNHSTPPTTTASPSVGLIGGNQPISFTINGDSNIDNASLTINGSPVTGAVVSSLPGIPVHITYTPQTPLPPGPIIFAVNAVDEINRTATPITFNYVVEDLPPNIFFSPPTYLTPTAKTIFFTVSDSLNGTGYGLALNKTSVTYSVNGGTAQTFAATPNVSNPRAFSYTFPNTIPNGATINYTVHAENVPPPGQTTGTAKDISATVLADFVAPSIGNFLVDNNVAAPSGSVLAPGSHAFKFTVTDNESGVQSGTALLYLVASAAQPLSASFTGSSQPGSQTFSVDFGGAPLAAGAAYVLAITVRDAAGNFSPQAVVHYTTVNDLTSPTVSIQITQTGMASTTFGTATIDNPVSGVDPAKVQILVDSQQISPLSVSNALQQGHIVILFGIRSDLSNGTHTVTVTAPSEGGMVPPTSATQDFTLSRPAVAISPSNGTTGIVTSATVTITDADCPVTSVNVTDNGTPLPASALATVVSGPVTTVTFAIPNGVAVDDTITVTAIDAFTNSGTATSHITAPPPPTPVLDFVTTGTDLITFFGTIPPGRPDLGSVAASATSGTVASTTFDTTTMQWSVAIGNDGSGLATGQIVFQNLNFAQSPASLSISQSFNAGTSPPNAVQPPPGTLPTPPPGAVVPPVGSVGSDSPGLSLYWNFDPNDVTGVSTQSRGWVPGTNKSSVHINCYAFGASGPVTFTVKGGLSANAPNVSPVYSFNIPLTSEGLMKDIEVTAVDQRGNSAFFHKRSLYLDRTKPFSKASKSAWKGTLPVTSQSDNFETLFSAIVNGTQVPAEDVTESGISRVTVTFPSTAPNTYTAPTILPFTFPPTNFSGACAPIQPGDTLAVNLALSDATFIYDDAHVPSASVNVTAIDGAGNMDSISVPYQNLPAPVGTASGETPQGVVGKFFTIFQFNPFAKVGTPIVVVGLPTTRSMFATYTTGDDNSVNVSDTHQISVSAFGQSLTLPWHTIDSGFPNNPSHSAVTNVGVLIPNKIGSTVATSRDDFLWAYQETDTFSDTIIRTFPPYNPGGPDTYNGRALIYDDPNFFINEYNQSPPMDKSTISRESTYGVVMPINDTFSRATQSGQYWQPDYSISTGFDPNLQKVIFDDGGLGAVSIVHSGNIKLWKSPNKSNASLIDDNFRDFERLGGQLYVEFLPGNGETGYIGIGAGTGFTIPIYGISDHNEGYATGDTTIPVGGPASIDLTSGALKCSWPLAVSSSVIIPPIFVSYNSRDNSNTAILPHFRHNLEMRVIRSAGYITLIDGDGRRVKFTPDQLLAAGADESSVTWNSDQNKSDFSTIKSVKLMRYGIQRPCYVLLRPSENRSYLFEQRTGKLMEIRDTNNNFATLEYDEYGGTGGNLQTIVDNRGIFLSFRQKSGSFSVMDVMGRTAKFDSAGVSGPLGSYSYTLSPLKRIITFTNAKGSQFTVNGSVDANEQTDVPPPPPPQGQTPLTLSNTFGVCYSVLRADNSRTLNVDYDFPHNSAVVHGYKGAGDPARDTTYAFDPVLNIWTSQTFDAGNGSGMHTLTQTPKGGALGRLINTRNNLLGGNWKYSYSEITGEVALSTDPDDISTTFIHNYVPNPRYDAAGPNFIANINQLAAVEDGKGQTTNYHYDGGTQFFTGTSDSIAATTYSNFDTYGVPQHVDGPRDGYSRDMPLDVFGRPASMTEKGEGTSSTTIFVTDAFGQVRELDLPDGRKILKSYDTRGHVITTQGPMVTTAEKAAGIQNGGISTAYYDALNMWTVMQDADGRSSSRTFDNLERMTTFTDRSFAIIYFEDFDALGNPQTVRYPPADAGSYIVEKSLFDLIGREYERDLPDLPDGTHRTIKRIFNDSAKTITTTALGITTVNAMKASGRSDTVKGPLGYQITNGYDANGVIESSTRQGYSVDKAIFDQHGSVTQSGPPELISQFKPDKGDAIVRTVLPGGIQVLSPVDALGRAASQSIGSDTLATFNYRQSQPVWVVDTVNLLGGATTTVDSVNAYYQPQGWHTLVATQGLGALGPVVQAIGGSAQYLDGGTPKITTDGRGKSITTVYDFPGLRYQGTTDQDNIGSIVTYTQSGNVKTVADERGKVTTSFYDNVTGFLIARRFPDGKGVTYTQQDIRGNPKFVTYVNNMDGSGQVVPDNNPLHAPMQYEYTYGDALGRLTQIKNPAGKIIRKIDKYYGNGLVNVETDGDGRTTTYVYDPVGRIAQQTDNATGQVTKTTYDPTGGIDTITLPDHRIRKYTYDNQGRVKTVTTTEQRVTTYNYQNGDRVQIVDARGRIVDMTYDEAHRMTLLQLPQVTGEAQRRTTHNYYDQGGRAIYMTDAKSNVFQMDYFDNGRRTMLSEQLSGAPVPLGQYFWDANVPVSDGATTWSLDDAGRVKSCQGVTYEYDHPIGMCTRKTYNGVDLKYTYDAAGYLQSMTDTNSGNAMTFTNRSVMGKPFDANYSNGIKVHWDYLYNNTYISGLKYTKADSTPLTNFSMLVDKFGKRQTLSVQPTNENFAYDYDQTTMRLKTETHTLPGFTSTTNYDYDTVGNRKTRAFTSSSTSYTETYVPDETYAIKQITNTNGTVIDFKYDLTGNTTEKKISNAPASTLKYTLRFANSGAPLQCSLVVDGNASGTLFLPSTAGAYQTTTLNVTPNGTIQLLIDAQDLAANGGNTVSIDVLEIAKGVSSYLLEAENATLQGVVAAPDTNASKQQAVANFGHAANDAITFVVASTPIDDPNYKIVYHWDDINRLIGAEHYNSAGDLKQTGIWNYQKTIGWQLGSQTIGSESRSYAYGYGGEVLSELIPSDGQFQGATRTYVNAGVDHVLWSYDNNNAAQPNYFLHDVNGSVYGIANSSANMIERQHFDAFGKTVLTQPNGAVQPISQTGNRMGFQGLENLSEFDMYNARNRFVDFKTGSFLSRDPLGMTGGDTYGFCGGDPVNNSDPMGLDPNKIGDPDFDWTNVFSGGWWINAGGGVNQIVDELTPAAKDFVDPHKNILVVTGTQAWNGVGEAGKGLVTQVGAMGVDAYHVTKAVISGDTSSTIEPQSALFKQFAENPAERFTYKLVWENWYDQGTRIRNSTGNVKDLTRELFGTVIGLGLLELGNESEPLTPNAAKFEPAAAPRALDQAPALESPAPKSYPQIIAEDRAAQAFGGGPADPPSPIAAPRRGVQGEYVEPATNLVKRTNKTLAADHIIPQSYIKQMKGYFSLTNAQKSAVLNYIENFQGLPKTYNSSKGAKLPSEFNTYKGKPLDPGYISRNNAMEPVLIEQLQKMIDDFNTSNGTK